MAERTEGDRFFVAAAAAGLVHAGFSLYWALGGRWLLRTVGKWAVTAAEDSPVRAGLLLLVVAAVKVVVAAFPVLASRRPMVRPRWWRVVAWLAAVVLVGYGGLNTVVAWLVLTGPLRPSDGYDHQAMAGHAYLWDPLFLVWGLLLGAGLIADRRSRRASRV